MAIFIFVFMIPELVVLLLTFYFGERSWNLSSQFLLLIYLIPVGGTILTFGFKAKVKSKLAEFRDYLIVTGLSMISLFYNSAVLLMWKLKMGFFWLIPVLAAEPVVALFYLKSLRETES